MKSKKITAVVLGIVLTLGLVFSGCGNNGASTSDGSAKAETSKDGYKVVNIGFPSEGYKNEIKRELNLYTTTIPKGLDDYVVFIKN